MITYFKGMLVVLGSIFDPIFLGSIQPKSHMMPDGGAGKVNSGLENLAATQTAPLEMIHLALLPSRWREMRLSSASIPTIRQILKFLSGVLLGAVDQGVIMKR